MCVYVYMHECVDAHSSPASLHPRHQLIACHTGGPQTTLAIADWMTAGCSLQLTESTLQSPSHCAESSSQSIPCWHLPPPKQALIQWPPREVPSGWVLVSCRENERLFEHSHSFPVVKEMAVVCDCLGSLPLREWPSSCGTRQPTLPWRWRGPPC